MTEPTEADKQQERTESDSPVDVKEAEAFSPAGDPDTNKLLLSRFGTRQEMSWKAFSIYCMKIYNAEQSSVDALKKILLDGGIVKKDRLTTMLDFFGPIAVETKAYAGEDEESKSALSFLATLISQTWFHGFIERKEAHKYLEGKAPGSFLVRFSSRKGKYALTVRVDNSKDHVMDWIIAPKDDKFRLDIQGGVLRDSVPDLIDYYTKNALPVSDNKIKGPMLVVEKRALGTSKSYTLEFDAFISHRQQTGGDLAQLIKLHLQAKNENLKIFLDVDDLHEIHDLKKNVENSRNVIVLLTDGVLDRPFVQMEIETAVSLKKNIIVVWDERSLPSFPVGDNYSDAIKSILLIKAIPYHRQKEFRDVSIQMIYEKLVFSDQNS